MRRARIDSDVDRAVVHHPAIHEVVVGHRARPALVDANPLGRERPRHS